MMIKIVKIRLTQRQVAIIDAEDASRVLRHKWCAVKTRRRYYAVTRIRRDNGTRRTMLLHRFILQLPPETPEVDHRDGDGLNNRRSNLRLATRSQNNQNSGIPSRNASGFKGVSWQKSRCKWRAQIGFNGYRKHLGLFETKEEAAAAYDKAACELFGEFARPNGVQLEFPFYDETATRLSRSKDKQQIELSL